MVVALCCERSRSRVMQNKNVDTRYVEGDGRDVTLLGPVGLVNDASWILQASYARAGADHVPTNDTSGQNVLSVLRRLITGAAVTFIPGSLPLNSLFGGEPWGGRGRVGCVARRGCVNHLQGQHPTRHRHAPNAMRVAVVHIEQIPPSAVPRR
jgi:hypothetical protein